MNKVSIMGRIVSEPGKEFTLETKGDSTYRLATPCYTTVESNLPITTDLERFQYVYIDGKLANYKYKEGSFQRTGLKIIASNIEITPAWGGKGTK